MHSYDATFNSHSEFVVTLQVNTAARIETTGMRNRIHLSEQTASLIMASGRKAWVHEVRLIYSTVAMLLLLIDDKG